MGKEGGKGKERVGNREGEEGLGSERREWVGKDAKEKEGMGRGRRVRRGSGRGERARLGYLSRSPRVPGYATAYDSCGRPVQM